MLKIARIAIRRQEIRNQDNQANSISNLSASSRDICNLKLMLESLTPKILLKRKGTQNQNHLKVEGHPALPRKE